MNMVCPTDFATAGVSLMVCVWKLKGFRVPDCGGPFPPPPPFDVPLVLVLNEGIAGLLKLLPEDGSGDAIEPNRPGKISAIGDNELGFQVRVECTVRPPSIPIPIPSGSSGIGVGGVGVRGGAGMGKLEAIVAVYRN